MNHNIPTLVCNFTSTIYVSDNGNVFSMGNITKGVHGHAEDEVSPPRIIPTLKNITSIASSGDHSVCLDYDGNVYTFGSNLFGQLGIGIDRYSLESTHTPQKVTLPSCIQVSCGDNFTICLTENGEVYSFGYNVHGQLGLGNNINSFNSPQKIEVLTNIEFIECGSLHIFVKNVNNDIYFWGGNNFGQLGIGNSDNQIAPVLFSSLPSESIVDIKCGWAHTLILTSNGDVLSCGHGYYGQLGKKTIGLFSPFFHKIEGLEGIIRIECGYCNSICIDINNNMYVFGNNEYGQLGLGDTDNR